MLTNTHKFLIGASLMVRYSLTLMLYQYIAKIPKTNNFERSPLLKRIYSGESNVANSQYSPEADCLGIVSRAELWK